jgi:hypothetical protein
MYGLPELIFTPFNFYYRTFLNPQRKKKQGKNHASKTSAIKEIRTYGDNYRTQAY